MRDFEVAWPGSYKISWPVACCDGRVAGWWRTEDSLNSGRWCSTAPTRVRSLSSTVSYWACGTGQGDVPITDSRLGPAPRGLHVLARRAGVQAQPGDRSGKPAAGAAGFADADYVGFP